MDVMCFLVDKVLHFVIIFGLEVMNMSNAAIMPMKWADDLINDIHERCACCSKVITGKPYWVEVINGGADVAAPGLGPDTEDGGYMGFYPVGVSCARKHFPGFYVRYANEAQSHNN